MGATHYSLPLPPKSHKASFPSPRIEPDRIRVVVPVYNDWAGLKTTLDSLMGLDPLPGLITVANDNIDNRMPEWFKTYRDRVEIVNYYGNQGPAYARNQGCGRISPHFDWFYFTDCGCEHVSSLIEHFISARDESGVSAMAICGTISGNGSGSINRYMTEMGILNPPFEENSGSDGQKVPQAIVTANALVSVRAFYQVGRFSTDFREAGGEDLDLGIRLRDIGELVWKPDAAVVHEFDEDSKDFVKRFERYGRGNRRLEQRYNLPSLRSSSKSNLIPSEIGEFQDLVKLQFKSLQRGYDQARFGEFQSLAGLKSVIGFSLKARRRLQQIQSLLLETVVSHARRPKPNTKGGEQDATPR